MIPDPPRGVIDELDQIERQPLVRESAIGPGSDLPWPRMSGRTTRYLRVRCGTPAEKAQKAAEAGMEQHDQRRLFPGIGEIVVAVMKPRAVAGGPVRCLRHLEPRRGWVG